jgi:hypothetical protein
VQFEPQLQQFLRYRIAAFFDRLLLRPTHIAKSRAKQQRRDRNGVLLDLAPKRFEEGSWVIVKPQQSYPLHKLAPRWLGPFRISRLCDDSEVVTVVDTVTNIHRRFLKRQLEHFDVTAVSNVEGLTKIAERDDFEFTVDAIIGHALVGPNGVGGNAEQLPQDFKRGARAESISI